MSVLTRWRAYQRAQREALRASNHPHAHEEETVAQGPDLLRDLTADDAAHAAPPVPTDGDTLGPTTDAHAPSDELPYGRAGRPLNRQSPFYLGFVGAFGVLIALGLWNTMGRLTTVITLAVVALFLTLALNPIVESLTRRG